MAELTKNKVLLIDDDRTFTTLIKGILTNAGYEVNVASNGAEGMRLIKESFPDLIILDVLMPEMTGYEFVQKIHREDPLLKAVPVIVISAKKSMKDFFNMWELAFFMIKPFQPAELLSKVEYALESQMRREKNFGQKKMSGHGRKALVVGHDEYSINNLQDIVEAEGFDVFTAKRETEGIVEAVKLLPDVIISQFHKVRGIMNAPKLREELLEKEVTERIPLIIICPSEMESECRKTFLTKQVIIYNSTREMGKKLQLILQSPLDDFVASIEEP